MTLTFRVEAMDSVILQWTQVVEKRAATRGAVDAITFVKNTRVVCLRYLAGSPILDGREFGLELTKEGLIPLLAPLFEGREPPKVRLGFTPPGVSRLIPGWKSPDLTTITDPCQTVIPHNLGEELAGVVRKLGWKITQPVWEECHVSTKSGPNAQALVSSIEDAHLLSDQQISDLLVVGGSELVRAIEVARSLSLLTWLSKFVIKTRKGERGLTPKGFVSRISAVKDKEAKCRIVAILDYWTQSALYPLHDSLWLSCGA